MTFSVATLAARVCAAALPVLSLLSLPACAQDAAPSNIRASEVRKPATASAARPARPNRPVKPVEGEFANFASWKEVSAFLDKMVSEHGFSRSMLETTFNKVRHVDTAIQLMKPAPPGKPKNWQAYRDRFINPGRIDAGVAFWQTHADALARAEEQFGVPAEIIVGIIGVETVYGRNTGNFRVMDALTTLAFDYPDTPKREARMAFFRSELEHVLLLSRERGIDPFTLLGSYAGAIGWPQFMPGTIRRFGIDFDNSGQVDLRNSPVDAIGSVAHYLVQHGWKRGEPIVFPAQVGADSAGASSWERFIGQGLEAKYTLAELEGAGVQPNTPVPEGMAFGLVDLQNGFEPTEYWLGGANFFAITQYNRSYFYAMSVVELSRAVRAARNAELTHNPA